MWLELVQENLELKLFRTHCNTQLKQLVLRRGFDFLEAVDQAAAGAVGGFGAGTGLRTTTELVTAGGLTAPEDMKQLVILPDA